MTTHMLPWHNDDFRSLLAAVSHEPVEDLPRLALADWLSEWASAVGEVECGACKGDTHHRQVLRDKVFRNVQPGTCVACSGRGTVPDVCADWSELIKVQMELARMETAFPLSKCPECVALQGEHHDDGCQYFALRSRESHLLPLVSTAVLLGPKCERCDGSGIAEVPRQKPLTGTMKYRCRCHKGHTGPLAAIPLADVTWRRGFPCIVKVPTLSVVWNIERDEPSEWAVLVARGAGWVEELVAEDAPIEQFDSESPWFIDNLFRHFRPGTKLEVATRNKDGGYDYSSESAAVFALARAVVRAARERVGTKVEVGR